MDYYKHTHMHTQPHSHISTHSHICLHKHLYIYLCLLFSSGRKPLLFLPMCDSSPFCQKTCLQNRFGFCIQGIWTKWFQGCCFLFWKWKVLHFKDSGEYLISRKRRLNGKLVVQTCPHLMTVALPTPSDSTDASLSVQLHNISTSNQESTSVIQQQHITQQRKYIFWIKPP